MGVILKIRRLFGLAGFEHDSDHWKSQRSSAIALFILGYWMAYQLLFFLNEASVSEVQQWIAEPLNSMLLALTVLYTFYHSELGLQVITEDYVESKSKQITILFIVRIIRLSLVTLTIISLMRI